MLTGVSRYIKHTKGKSILSVAVEPAKSPVISQARAGQPPTPSPHKIQGIGAGFVPENLDLDLVDRVEQVTDEESIEGLSFPCFRRVATLIMVPAAPPRHQSIEMIAINSVDLADAQQTDARASQ